MNKILQWLMLGVLISFPGFSLQAEEPKKQNKERTVWVDPKTGSLIGGGYAQSGETAIFARTVSHENPRFRNAIDYLDAQGGIVVRGVGLVPAAVAWQTKLPVRTLVAQQAQTRLSYGELLIVNSLAEGTEKSFTEILTLRGKGRSWGELALKLHVNPDSITARAEAAANSIVYAEARGNRRREQNLHDAGYDMRRSQNPSVAPHAFGTRPGEG